MDMFSVFYGLSLVGAFFALILICYPIVMFVEWFRYWRGTDKTYWDLLKEEW